MSDQPLFETQKSYELPLLRLLAKIPGGQGQAKEVRRLFEQEYGPQIPPKHRGTLKGRARETIWENNLNWSRNNLRERGFVDMPQTGIWRITQAGRDWLAQNPNADRLPPFTYHSKSQPTERRRSSKPSTRQTAALPAGITLEMLEQTRKFMPADQFRQTWGIAYDQLLAAERARAMTEINQTELGRRARRKLDDIHAFLAGRNNASPKSEVLCDWIHFCYELELHREAASLLPYVREDEVDPGFYRRAKKWAEASRVKLGW